MPFNFRRIFNIGGLRLGVGKRGLSSVGFGRITKSRGRSTRITIPTGIRGLSFSWGGKSKRKRRWLDCACSSPNDTKRNALIPR